MDYIKEALRTDLEFEAYETIVAERMGNAAQLLHAAMGMTTEVGEFMDVLKKYTMYGKPIDEVNLREELGDLMWYMAIACHELETTFEEVQERNIAKLRARYPEKFNEAKALTRDLGVERKILEG